MSYHFCQNKQKTADTPAPLFVKLKNELYSSTYWRFDAAEKPISQPLLTTKTLPNFG